MNVKHYTSVDNHRPCNVCHCYLEMNEDNFYRRKNGKFQAVCKECKRAYKRNYYIRKRIEIFNRFVGG